MLIFNFDFQNSQKFVPYLNTSRLRFNSLCEQETFIIQVFNPSKAERFEGSFFIFQEELI